MSDLFTNAPGTIPEALRRARDVHGAKAVTMLDARGRDAGRRTYIELVRSLEQAAGRYRSLGIEPGDRVLICLPTSWSWLESWFGALLNGALPVAIAPPGALGSPTLQVRKTLDVCSNLGARYLICTDTVKREIDRQLSAHTRLPEATTLLTEAQLAATPIGSWSWPQPGPAETDVAFLQLTSGSTGLPRAVQIPHGAALHNCVSLGTGVAAPYDGEPNDAIVSWLPLYHDMGLIGCLMLCLVAGYDLTLMRPRTFLARPWVWLEAIQRHRRVMAPAPNFAYQLCVERCAGRDLSAIDLSTFRDPTCGSEMVRRETIEAFDSTFGPVGFEGHRVRPGYGLAEATLAVTLDQGPGLRTRTVPDDGMGTGLVEAVSNGPALPGMKVLILGSDGQERPTGSIGEICIEGPCIFSGYYNDPQATAKALDGRRLHTGDLGFVDERGELYITGRTKEILILNGHNMMPHEIEHIADGLGGLGGSQRSAAFSIDSPHGEKAVLVVESRERDPDRAGELAHDIRTAVGRSLQIPLADILLVKRGSIPRTSSGKLMRGALRDLYLGGELRGLEHE